MSLDVRNYYDRNTRSFLRFGRGSGATGAIHRELWAPGVTSHIEALHYIHRRIVAAFVEAGVARPHAESGDDGTPRRSTVETHLADLGCGVGASTTWIGRRLDARVSGVTLSAIQAHIGMHDIARSGEAHRRRIIQGDFAAPATFERLADWGPLDGAWMIESFNHADDAAALFAHLADHMRPGGVLAVCDDLPAPSVAPRLELSAVSSRPRNDSRYVRRRHRRWIDEFRRGWHVHTFLSSRELEALAREHGFERYAVHDFSAYAALDRPRDLLVRLVAGPAAFFRLSGGVWDNVRGGNALQQLAKRGLMRYELCLFRRV